MTFRKRILKKKFCKNDYHTLQGTMSHRPLTNTSSLKITAAYWTACVHFRDSHHRVHIFTRDETGLVYLPTQLGRTLQLYW
jgi:hypothetical protein